MSDGEDLRDRGLHPDGFDLLAANELNNVGDSRYKDCTYDECDNEAKWVVVVDHQDAADVVGIYVCESCSRENRLWIEENDVDQNDAMEYLP